MKRLHRHLKNMTMISASLTLISLLLLVDLGYAQSNPIKVASYLSPPYLVEHNSTSYSGLIKEFLDELDLPAYEIKLPGDRMYGKKTTEGWTGMMGMLFDGSVDMVVADLTATSKRIEDVDLTMPFLTSQLTVMVKHGHLGSIWLGCGAFETSVWLLLVGVVLVVSFSFWMISRISPYQGDQSSTRFAGPEFRSNSLCDSFWFVSTAFLTAASHPRNQIKSLSARILTIGCALFGLAVIISYAVGTISLMMKPSRAFSTVEELLGNPTFRFKLIKNGATHTYLKASTDPINRGIFNRVLQHPDDSFISSTKEAVEQMLLNENDENSGIVIEGNTADYFLSHHCSLYTVGRLGQRHYSIALKKGSQLTAKLSKKILELQETGVLHRLRLNWLEKSQGFSQQCASTCFSELSKTKMSIGKPLSVNHFVTYLVFLSAVVAVSVVLAFAELAHSICFQTPLEDENNKKQCSQDQGTKADRKNRSILRETKIALCGCFPVSSGEAK